MKHFLKKYLKSARKVNRRMYLTSAFIFFLFFSAFAQTGGSENVSQSDLFSNSLFLLLVSVALFLLIIIVNLISKLKNISAFFKNNKPGHGSNIIGILIILGTFLSQNMMAQGTGEEINLSASSTIGGVDSAIFFLLVSVILLELITVIALAQLIKHFEKNLIARDAGSKNVFDTVESFLDSLSASVPIKQEHDILLDHDYDGIRELDNNLPPWWKYGFYITIVVSIIYFFNYHVFHTGNLQVQEYKQEILDAELQMAEYRKSMPNIIDETNVVAFADDISIANGKKNYLARCGSCHGKLGEGKVAPNLTDDYWVHGGDIKSVFKIIKYGYTDKGMKAWDNEFSPKQINELASFILTLKGSNPPNAKVPQGVLYTVTNDKKEEPAKGVEKANAAQEDSISSGINDTIKK